MMGLFCAHCERAVGGGLKRFQKHLARHDSPFLCCEEGCNRRKFAVKTSLYRHLRDHHSQQCEQSSSSSSSSGSSTEAESSNGSDSSGDSSGESSTSAGDYNHENLEEPAAADLNNEGGDENPDEDNHDELAVSLEREAARMILNLRKRGNVTGVAISLMIEETQKLLSCVVDAVKIAVARNLENVGIEDEVIKSCVGNVFAFEPFKKLQSKKQQIAYFKDNFGYVSPMRVSLGTRPDTRIGQQGVALPIEVQLSFQYVSVTETLKAVLNNKVLFKLIHSEKKSTDGKMRSYLDGSLADRHPIISQHPYAIRLTLHVDDADYVNPLGAKSGIHKITEVQFQLQNLPPEENARLRSVFILAYAYREDLPAHDPIGAIMEPFLLELQDLESEDGKEICVDGHPYTLRATLVAGAADALAAHEILGLYSTSCNRFCTLCTISKKDFYQDIFAMGAARTKELHQFHLSEINKRSEDYMKKNYGVKAKTNTVVKSKYAEFPEAFIKDGMHDILKGVAPMEIKLALHQFCCKKRYFDVYHFNARLQSFNYGKADSRNKPTANFTPDSVGNQGSYHIHQSAAQTWCLLQVFPFLVGDKVPLDDPHFKLIVLLKRISSIIFSHVISESDLIDLQALLQEHHELFFALYPADAPAAPSVDNVNDLENDPDDPEGMEDFLEITDEPQQNAENSEEETDQPDQNMNPSSTLSANTQPRKKHKKKIRPLNKHHHLLHYPDMMRKYGPAVLYWCMRFEGKHALPKRFGAIVSCFKNLTVTYADLQQMYQCAEFLNLKTEVRNEIHYSVGVSISAEDVLHYDALHVHGISQEDILQEVKQTTIAGFSYEKGLYINLQLQDNLPLFGMITNMYVHNDKVFIVTKDYIGRYDKSFGAFLIENIPNPSFRALVAANLPCDRPLTPWTADNVSFYLSPRRTLAESLLELDEN